MLNTVFCMNDQLLLFCFSFQIEEAGPLFCVAYVGAFLICLGMVSIQINLISSILVKV